MNIREILVLTVHGVLSASIILGPLLLIVFGYLHLRKKGSGKFRKNFLITAAIFTLLGAIQVASILYIAHVGRTTADPQ